MRRGQPLLFLGAIISAWTLSRAALVAAPMHWPPAGKGALVLAAIETIFPITEIVSAPADLVRSMGEEISARLPEFPGSVPHSGGAVLAHGGGWGGGMTADALLASSLAFVHAPRSANRLDLARFEPGAARREPVEAQVSYAQAEAQGRWRGTGWLLWRPEGSDYAVPGSGQLGGSQAGVRVDHAIAGIGSGEVSAYGRVSAAMERPYAGEGAVGLAWRPGKSLPVTLAVERRQRLSAGGRNAFAAYVAGGIGPLGLGEGFELEGYGQAGVVGLRALDGFADGKLSVTRRVTRPGTRRDVAVGASLSGGVQPGASRLDIGPEVRFRLPIGNDRARISAEWRERIAGEARPASGPAVTLIGEF